MTRRGDVDDRVLTEAMLPVLHRLADVKDVRPLLRHRFNMPKYASSSVPPLVHVCVREFMGCKANTRQPTAMSPFPCLTLPVHVVLA